MVYHSCLNEGNDYGLVRVMIRVYHSCLREGKDKIISLKSIPILKRDAIEEHNCLIQ